MAVDFAAPPRPAGGAPGLRDRVRGLMSDDLRHYWAGRRDGSRCLPAVDDDSSTPPGHLQDIATACAGILESRWTALLVQTERDRIALSGVLPELARATMLREAAALALKEHLATKPEETRRHGEEQLPPDLVLRRRRREYSKATRRLSTDCDRTRDYVTQLLQRRAELESNMSLQLEIAQSEAREQHRLYSRAASVYLRGAQRTHHDPDGLIRKFETFALPRPDWVSLDGMPAFLRASGAESDI